MTSDSASRVMRSRASLRRALMLFAACLALAGVLRAQEAARTVESPAAERTDGTARAPAAEPDTPVGEPVPAVSAPAKGTAQPVGADDRAASGPEKSATEGTTERTPGVVGTTPGRFEPTEKVRADFDVSFPVDI